MKTELIGKEQKRAREGTTACQRTRTENREREKEKKIERERKCMRGELGGLKELEGEKKRVESRSGGWNWDRGA